MHWGRILRRETITACNTVDPLLPKCGRDLIRRSTLTGFINSWSRPSVSTTLHESSHWLDVLRGIRCDITSHSR